MNEEYLDWLDNLVASMLNTPYVSATGPVKPSASLVNCLNEYLEMRNNDIRIDRRINIINDVISDNRITELENRVKELENLLKK